MAARGEVEADAEVSTLVVPAWRLRWRAPELALVLGERAVALASARRDEVDRLRAESLVVFASNQVGRGVRVAERALDALRAAESAAEHETAWRLRVELADSARSVGAPLTGFAAVRPVLEADDVPESLRATALVQAAECLVSVGRGTALTEALAEADRLYQADPVLDHDTKSLLRGLLRAAAAGQQRRWGDLAAAIAAGREGLELLDRLEDPAADSGLVRGRLTLELVCALLDANQPKEASEVGSPLLDRPVRAPSAATSGWLRLALATRVHLPAGRVDQAHDLLRDAADSAERHQLDTLLAESLLALAHVHEVSGELTEALADLRSAHAAERRRARAVYAVRARLAAEFAGVHRQPTGLHDLLAALVRGEKVDAAAQPSLAPELKQQLRQWRPVQVQRGEGARVKRPRRAGEDMTVEGISAARAHAADRWRLAQPFGEISPEAAQPPAAQAPGAQSPVVQSPVVQSPVVQSPAVQSPAVQPPASTAPASPPQGFPAPENTGAAQAASEAPAAAQAAPTPPRAAQAQPAPGVPAAPAVPPPAPNPVPAAGTHPGTQQGMRPADQRTAQVQPPAPGRPTPEWAPSPPARPAQPGPEWPSAQARDLTPGAPERTTGEPGRAAAPIPESDAEITQVGIGLPPIGRGPEADQSGPGTDRGGPALDAPRGPAGADAGTIRINRADLVLDPTGPEAGQRAERPAQPAAPQPAAPQPAGPQPADTASTAAEPAAEPAGESADARSADRPVPAAGLIAAAGAVRSGRRRAAREASEEQAEDGGGVLESLKAAGLLKPQGAGGRRRAPDADDSGEPETPPSPPADVPWRVRPPARLRTEEAEPPARTTPEAAPDVPQNATPDALQDVTPDLGPDLDPDAPGEVDMFDSPTMVQPIVGADGLPVQPPTGLGAAFAKGPLIPTARVPEPYPAEEPPAAPGPATEPEPDNVPPAPEPDQVPPVAVPDPVPDQPIPMPDPIPRPPTHFGFDLGAGSFLSPADVEPDEEAPTRPTSPAPQAEEPEEPKEPFVTSVVVGGRSIELPPVVEPVPDSPSATRASRRPKSDLSLAELLAEALVAYEAGRREEGEQEEGVPADPDNETTAPIQRLDTWTPPES
ncbi:hypothetical protein [Saccharothrix coeruleofusca]|uniref:Uncharacterized protein n=1 Tax=Saccharothrix coeruleofusca TaxID=33919 RepID=A0A918AHM8_9PSEU|nr:hypothetical protein [Saccharothrix coeruleofusca]GGP43246.1 hypothetical protein GCM10010185_13500 [Saccharothrix coeruleofusca]